MRKKQINALKYKNNSCDLSCEVPNGFIVTARVSSPRSAEPSGEGKGRINTLKVTVGFIFIESTSN